VIAELKDSLEHEKEGREKLDEMLNIAALTPEDNPNS